MSSQSEQNGPDEPGGTGAFAAPTNWGAGLPAPRLIDLTDRRRPVDLAAGVDLWVGVDEASWLGAQELMHRALGVPVRLRRGTAADSPPPDEPLEASEGQGSRHDGDPHGTGLQIQVVIDVLANFAIGLPPTRGLNPRPPSHGEVNADGPATPGQPPVDERHVLSIPATGLVTISAVTPEGAYRGVMALARVLAAAASLPIGRIVDGPVWSWRGLSFDAVRHFYTTDELRRVIDLLSWHGFSVLHLHLTDMQEWRIQIEGIPELTPDPSVSYTQAHYRELVEYAAARYVTIIPEVDMPGHIAAAVARLPQLASATVPPHPLLTYLDPNTPAVQEFVTTVIRTLVDLSGGPYVHIGGDEAFGMPEELYAQFITEAAEQVRGLGKIPLAWQEAARSDSFGPADALQVWVSSGDAFDLEKARTEHPPEVHPLLELVARTFELSPFDAPRAAAAGVPMVASPSGYVYLDRRYAESSLVPAQNERAADLGHPGYRARPALHILDWRPEETPEIAQAGGRIEAVEAAIWAESIESFDDLGLLLLPRLAILAERFWFSEHSSPVGIEERLRSQTGVWGNLGFGNYFRSEQIF